MKITCIVCPNGCEIEVDGSTGKASGNKCKRGEAFALQEILHPMRTVTTTVKTVFRETPVIPVRLNKEIPRERIVECIQEIHSLKADKRLGRGDVLIHNVLGLDADVIITSDRLKENIK